MSLPVAFIGGMSPLHWIIVLVIVLLLFGNRLPSVMRSLGRGMVEFKKGMEGIGDESEEDEKPKQEKKAEKEAAEK